MRKTMVGLLVVVGLVACTTDMGAMLTDAGNILVDAGDAMSDDAAAQDDAGSGGPGRLVEVPCDAQGIVTATYADGSTRQHVTNYAGLEDLAVSTDRPDIAAEVCTRRVVTAEPGVDLCAGATHCTNTEPMHRAGVTVPVEIDNGRASVVCGSSDRFDPDGSGPMVATETGVRYDFARFYVPN
jgi:hypothetical protein